MNQVEMSRKMFEENDLSAWENAEISRELIAEDIQEQNNSNHGDEDTSEKEVIFTKYFRLYLNVFLFHFSSSRIWLKNGWKNAEFGIENKF
jgi:hypothetical protein